MLFPTHLVAAALLGRQWRLSTSLVVLGAALPDVVDKPAAMVGAFDLFQSVGHSLLTVAVLAVVVAYSHRWLPFLVGWCSHLALDAFHMVVNGRAADVQFLAWPFVRHTPAVDLPPLAFATVYVGTPSFYVEVVIWAAFGYVLVRDRRTPAAADRSW